MAEEPKKPFKLSPSPMTAVLMIAFAICIDALQFFLGLALTAVVGVGLAVAWMLSLLAYVVLWIWFKLSDNNTKNHYMLMRILAYYGALVIEFIPGLDFFPAMTFGVLSRILISWAGDAKANKLAEQEAEGKKLSAGNERRYQKRMQYKATREGIESAEQSRDALQKKARDDAKPGKERQELARRQEEKDENIGMKAAGIIASGAPLPVKAVAASVTALDAYRRDKERRKSATRPGSPPARRDPYTEDVREAA